MEFMDFPPPRKRRTLLTHLMILGVVALSLITFGLANDEITGKAKLSDAYAFTFVFLVTGYYIGWLPEIWKKTNKTSMESFVTPAFIALILAYLYFSFRTYFVQPGATGLAFFCQLFVMVFLSCRTA